MSELAPLLRSICLPDPPARSQIAAGYSDPDYPTIVQEVMTKDVPCVDVDDSLKEAADKMRSLEIGYLPVCRDGRPVGIVTDREIFECFARSVGNVSSRRVSELMSPYPHVCLPNEDLAKMLEILQDFKLRCVLVIDQSGKLVGALTHQAIRQRFGDSESLFVGVVHHLKCET